METGELLARSVREKIHRAAEAVTRGEGDLKDRLVKAWCYLRPLFPKAVPGQAGLTFHQRMELQRILDSLGGGRGAGANGLIVRSVPWADARRASEDLQKLAATLPRDAGPASLHGPPQPHRHSSVPASR